MCLSLETLTSITRTGLPFLEELIDLPKMPKVHKRKILQTAPYTFTSIKIQLESGATHVYSRTIKTCLNKGGYFNLKSREKRVIFKGKLQKECKVMPKHQKIMSKYINDNRFQLTQNPLDPARTPKT